jgi:hypothetical protein
MVLFYVYPLKFMFDSMFAQILRWDAGSRPIVPMSFWSAQALARLRCWSRSPRASV